MPVQSKLFLIIFFEDLEKKQKKTKTVDNSPILSVFSEIEQSGNYLSNGQVAVMLQNQSPSQEEEGEEDEEDEEGGAHDTITSLAGLQMLQKYQRQIRSSLQNVLR